MTDEELGQYIVSYGDRLALRAFCRQKTGPNEQAGIKSTLMQKVRDRLREREQRYTVNGETAEGRGVGNKHAAKVSRRIELGWLHYSKGDFHQVRARHGGGTRHLTVEKTVKMEHLLETGKDLFFPNGQSSKGPVENFNFDVRDFSHSSVSLESTVSQLYNKTKLKMLRIYICSKEKDIVSPNDTSVVLSDTSSDFEASDVSPMKVIYHP